MTATDIVTRRLGISIEDAKPYIDMADSRVRSYVNTHGLSSPDSTTLTFAVADIAVLYWQKDSATQASKASLGFASQTYSEGGVSWSGSGVTGASAREAYDAAIEDVLASLDADSGKVVFM